MWRNGLKDKSLASSGHFLTYHKVALVIASRWTSIGNPGIKCCKGNQMDRDILCHQRTHARMHAHTHTHSY